MLTSPRGYGAKPVTNSLGEETPVVRIGDEVRYFTLADDEGQTWTLSEHGGSTVLLIFHRHLM